MRHVVENIRAHRGKALPARVGRKASFENWFARTVAPLYRVSILGSPAIHLRIRSLADLKLGQKVLELASGPVPYHRIWESKLGPKGSLVVSDIDPWIVKANQRLSKKPVFKKTPKKSFAVVDINKIDTVSNFFDRIVVVSPFGMQGFNEIFRVLKPGGKAVLFEIAEFVNPELPIPEFSKRSENLARETGFSVEKKGAFFSPYPHQYLVLKKPSKP